MRQYKKLCKICKGYCFNKLKHSEYCKDCEKVSFYVNRMKSNNKVLLKRNLPDYKFKISIKFNKKK